MHFVNEYDYGDLSADPTKLLEKYFDVHVHLSNWGTRRVAMRLPADTASIDEVASYCVGETVYARRSGEHIIVDLWSETEEPEGWVDGQGWMGSLAGVRTALVHGDRRPLYLAWLLCVENCEVGEEEEEPPVPSGLGNGSVSFAALTEFLRIDRHLVEAAAEGSPPEAPEPAGLAHWIAGLKQEEKDALLVRVAQGEHASVGAALVRRFRTEMGQQSTAPASRRRTVAEILARANELREAGARRRARKAADAKRKDEQAAKAARAKRLDALAARKPEAWRSVHAYVDSRKQVAYDMAVRLLMDLRALAVRDDDQMQHNSPP